MAQDAIALLEARGMRAGLVHRSGQVAADDERELQRHGDRACADVGIDGVDGDRAHLDADFACFGLGRGQIAVDDRFGGAGLVDVGSFHRGSTKDEGRSTKGTIANFKLQNVNWQLAIRVLQSRHCDRF